MLGYIILFLIGLLILLIITVIIEVLIPNKKDKDGNLHIKPSNYFYSSRYNYGWADITKCEDCGTTGMLEDLHSVHPCSNCGGVRLKTNPRKFNFKTRLWEKRSKDV